MSKRTYSESGDNEVPQAKRLCFDGGTPHRSEGQARKKLQLQKVSPRNISMQQVKNSPMRRAIKQGMTVLKFIKAKTNREAARSGRH